MDPNTIKPSPPSSLCSPSSLESLKSTSTPTTGYSLPFSVYLAIVKYAADECEIISFDVLQKHEPALLEERDIDCAEQVELNWSCKRLPPFCPKTLEECLQDWLPDIRHASVHRNKMTALAACRTIYEAANFATTMGYEEVGRKLISIATEMDWCRSGM